MIKFNYLINTLLTLLLAFGLAYFVSSIIYLKYSGISVKLPEVGGSGKNESIENRIDKNLILTKNLFNLDVYNVQSGDISTNNSAVTVQSGASDFKGTLVGIIKGQEKSFALIRDEQNFFILSEGETDKGLKVEEIGLKDVTIIYQGKKYNLKLASSDKTYLNTQKYSGVEQTNGAGTTKTVVTRKDVEENMSDINGLIRTMYISPYYVGGEFVGYRIARMRMDAFLRKAGIENGDVLVRMNGEKVDTPEKMFELFTRWKDASAVTIDLLRMDQRKTILVEIQ